MEKMVEKAGCAVKERAKLLLLLLPCSLLLSLAGCGNESGSTLEEVQSAFAAQRSVVCSIQYTVGLSAVIDETEYPDLEQSCTVDLQADLSTLCCYVTGRMTPLLEGEDGAAIEVEAYGDSSGSYYRYNDTYLSDPSENAFLTLAMAPLTLNLEEHYTAQAVTEIIYGSSCTVYSGTEVADDSTQRWLGTPAAEPFSLEGCLIDVLFCIYENTRLPACVRLDYSNLAEMGISFTDEDGGVYTLTSLRYEILYQSYGTEVSTDVPEEFRQAALAGGTVSDAALGEAPEGGESQDGQVQAGHSAGAADGETESGTYLLTSSDGSYAWEIGTPAYMALDERSDSAVSFYYFYAKDDFELITYTLYEDFTGQDEADYAAILPDFYRESNGIRDVESEGVQSLTTGGYEVEYIAVTFTLEQDGVEYQVIDIYSWVEALNGTDCLEVSITEFNCSGDGILIDPETELEYAYESVLGLREG